ncbi:hypothetical protein GGR58DRAFT_529372 [Xylaria digitata]|nr:hypothetical protein GGR58DRAFT_529372 [Xylaria digitata]
MSTRPDEYTVLCVCAAQVKFNAAKLFLDEHYKFKTKHIDPDLYFCGRIGLHNIIVLLLSTYEYTTAATPQSDGRTIKHIVQNFPKIRIALAVGIGGSAPTQKNDIRLGDVVVGLAEGTRKSVFTFDISKTLQSRRFESIEVFDPPSSIFAAYIPTLQGYHRLTQPNDFIKAMLSIQRQTNPVLMSVSKTEPMEDASIRDALAVEGNVLCFETEAYRILKELSRLVIRGIGNYSDSYKSSNEWQSYAAMTASFYARELLRQIPPRVFDLQRVQKPSLFFRIGRCFVTQWVEPMSSRLADQSSAPTTRTPDPHDGAFTKPHRFIVIREGYHSAWRVPIHTYQGRGTTKPDIKLYDHAKIYRFGSAEVEAECPLRKPIGIVIEGESELHQLHPASLANFGKIYTIEHDVSVMNIGYVPRCHISRVKLDLNALEISTPNMKYHRLRRDEGPFNIQLRGKEKLNI